MNDFNGTYNRIMDILGSSSDGFDVEGLTKAVRDRGMNLHDNDHAAKFWELLEKFDKRS